MAFSVTSSDLYAYGARESYFKDAAGVTLTTEIAAALLAATGECSRALSPRVGGPASGWTFGDAAGEAEAKRDICVVAASELALSQGLVLPGEGADPQWLARARAVRETWARMGAVGGTVPLYSGLTDATAAEVEGGSVGWAGAPMYEAGEEA